MESKTYFAKVDVSAKKPRGKHLSRPVRRCGVAGGEQVTRGAARLVFEAFFIFEVVFIFDGDKAVELFVRLT